jgi:AcrR family transcriptional regulator
MPGVESLSARQQILAAAVELFAERGRAGASLRELATRVGLHNSTLFHYFPDKESLAASALDAVAERQLEWLERLEADVPPALETLESVLSDWDHHLRSAPAEARLLLDAVAGPGSGALARDGERPPVERMTKLLESWLRRADSAGVVHCPSPGATARHLLALLLFRPGRPDDGDEPAGELARFALAALRPRTRSRRAATPARRT